MVSIAAMETLAEMQLAPLMAKLPVSTEAGHQTHGEGPWEGNRGRPMTKAPPSSWSCDFTDHGQQLLAIPHLQEVAAQP